MTVTFKLRRGLASQWTAGNPTLLPGEPALEIDTGKFKIGDGVKSWNTLPYFLDADDTTVLIQTLIEAAVLNGVPGTPGKSAYQVAVDNGFVGTVTQWLTSLVGPAGTNGTNGADGASAYQVAVAGGFVGTQAQWLTSLVGPQGIQGIKGDPGDLNRVAVVLTDQATITTNCTLSNRFRVTLGGNRTLGNPTGMTDGQSVIWEIIQDGTGSRTITLDTSFVLGTDIAAVTLSTTAGKRDFLGAVYNATAGKWSVVALARGY